MCVVYIFICFVFGLQFMEMTRVRYHQQAVEAGVYIVSACGFDSIPNDLGVLYTEEQFKGDLHYVETFLQGHSASTKVKYVCREISTLSCVLS